MTPPKHIDVQAPSSGLKQQQLGPACPTLSLGKQPGLPTPTPGLWGLQQRLGPKTLGGRLSILAAECISFFRRPHTHRVG